MDSSNAIAVRVEPLGVSVPVQPGETLMAAALRAGLRWPTLCRGNGLCGYCHVEIVETDTALPVAGSKELRTLDQTPQPAGAPPRRLACQLRPNGRLIVCRVGVRGPDASV